MPLLLAPSPTELSWLHPACRPSSQEVDDYDHFIADHENPAISALSDISHRRDEAELQLWLWHHETHQPTARE